MLENSLKGFLEDFEFDKNSIITDCFNLYKQNQDNNRKDESTARKF